MTGTSPALSRTRFVPPPGSAATAPPERRGVPRDGVRLLVARSGVIRHLRFHDLPDQLVPGDLLVVNISGTLPAAVDAHRADGSTAPVHVSTELDGGEWAVEVRRADGAGADPVATAGEELVLPGGVRLRLRDSYPEPARPRSRLWRAGVAPPVAASVYLLQYGRPIGYSYLAARYPISDFQTVYAHCPGSAEMPSAGRPITARLLVKLMSKGVTVTPVVLHAGVSSPDKHEPPLPERFAVPEVTARLVNSARAAERRVVAVGTTVTRALESVAGPDGTVRAASGLTDLVLGPGRPAQVVTGLLTGLHAPEASHLSVLEAVAGAGLVQTAYQAAVQQRYLWHEFGDSMAFLP